MLRIESAMEKECVSTNAEILEADPVIEAYKRQIDRTLLRERLKLTIAERFARLRQLQRFAEELRRAGRAAS